MFVLNVYKDKYKFQKKISLRGMVKHTHTFKYIMWSDTHSHIACSGGKELKRAVRTGQEEWSERVNYEHFMYDFLSNKKNGFFILLDSNIGLTFFLIIIVPVILSNK